MCGKYYQQNFQATTQGKHQDSIAANVHSTATAAYCKSDLLITPAALSNLLYNMSFHYGENHHFNNSK